jgi:hypothetical protein
MVLWTFFISTGNVIQGRKELSSNLSLLQMLVTEQEESAEIGKNLIRTAESKSEYEKWCFCFPPWQNRIRGVRNFTLQTSEQL